jgi:hypothetical protein
VKKYTLTEEHKQQFKPHTDKWIANAMSTKAMDDEERAIVRESIKAMYEAVGKKPPPPERIVFVASPFIAKFAAGFAAAIWWKRKNPKSDATDAATAAATRDATDAATVAATVAATDDATYAATSAATDAATRDATAAATSAATVDKKSWYQFSVDGMKKLSAALGLGIFGLKCANNTYQMWNGGNQWSGWVSFLSFFKDVVKLGIDYTKYVHYENCAIHAGPRYMHEEFCIVSDRPKKLVVNELSQPHCVDGPFCEWRDGSALYALNGVRVPMWIVETKPEDFTKEMILGEENADYRREIVRKLGPLRTAEILQPRVADSFKGYELLMIDLGDNRERPFLKMVNPSLGTVHIEGVGPDCKTVIDALGFRNGTRELPATIDGVGFGDGVWHQQGDCLLFTADAIPSGAIEDQTKMAADGLRRHVVVNGDVFAFGEDRYIAAHAGCYVSHPEHNDVPLDVGFYRVGRVMEYDHWKEEARRVID